VSSQERERDVQALRAVYEGWAQGDFHDVDVFTDDIVWVTPEGPERGTFVGIEEFTKSWSAFLEAWDDLRNEAEEILPTPDGRYLVMQVFRARGRASGVAVEDENAVLFTMRDGKIARMEGHWSRDSARRAAGLEEGGP
jgi:ketosteroid isomerase-like protein